MKIAVLWLVFFAVRRFFSPCGAFAFMLGSLFEIVWMYWFDDD